MDFGITIPIRGPLATPQSITSLVQRAEDLDFAGLAVTDHLVVPTRIDSTYPYSASGEWPGRAAGDCFDQFTVMAFLAAVARKARLVSAVTVIPHRGAVHTAKLVATIDVLSQGRVTLGVGAGWMKEEFEALGAPPFEARGRVTDEYLQAFKILWTEDDPRFDGKFAAFSDICFLPKPVQKPHPPIWVGGESPAALRRAARFGDAWFPIGNNPLYPLDTLARYSEGVRRLRDTTERNDRDPDTVLLTYFTNWYDESKTITLDDGQRMLLTGSAQQVADDISAMGELGVRHLVFNMQRATLEQSVASMQHFADEVRPLVAIS